MAALLIKQQHRHHHQASSEPANSRLPSGFPSLSLLVLVLALTSDADDHLRSPNSPPSSLWLLWPFLPQPNPTSPTLGCHQPSHSQPCPSSRPSSSDSRAHLLASVPRAGADSTHPDPCVHLLAAVLLSFV